jgi:hypothetical protein
VSRLYARTNSEAHLYMDLHPCTCGDIEFERQSAVMTEDDVLCSRYSGPCRTCGTVRTFIFELPETIRPIRSDGVDFGGSDASQLLDPGEWLAVADYYAKLDPGTREDLDIARAAVEEVLKFVPEGAERVPDEAFRSARGRAVRDAEPGRFRRVRLEAVLGAYRDLVAKYAAPAAAAEVKPPEPPPPPPDQYPLQVLVEALATVVAKQQGFQGTELRRHISDLKGQVQSLVQLFQIKAKEELARQQTSAELEQLLEGIARSGTAVGKTVAENRDAISQAFRGVDLARIADGLQVLSEWMRNPTAEKTAPVQEMIANLQSTMGPMAGMIPGAEDEARREQIHKEVRASLDEIFRPEPKKS